jgi:checkpoint serine/threonine-protein kinase
MCLGRVVNVSTRNVPFKLIKPTTISNSQRQSLIKRRSTPAQPSELKLETFNVVQLPHKPGFIENQIQVHGLLNRGDYHLFKDEIAQVILRKLRSWFPLNDNQQKHRQLKMIQLGNYRFRVVKRLGQGGMAHVFLAQDTSNLTFYGLKVQQPAHPWEYYILCQLHQRLDRTSDYSMNLLPIHQFYQYQDASFLLMSHICHGTLLDALNLYRPNQSYMPEPIVLLLAMQLLKEMMVLHMLQIVHYDLKLDNIMLMFTDSTGMPNIMMIDFGHSVDLMALAPGTQCKALWPPDFPFLNQAHYPIHADYWQMAAMVHLLLFGCPMHATKSSRNEYTINQTIKRYWHKAVWTRFFQVLLNPISPPPYDSHSVLKELLTDFEAASGNVSNTHTQNFITLLRNKHKN